VLLVRVQRGWPVRLLTLLIMAAPIVVADPDPVATITLSPNPVQPGGHVTVSGQDWDVCNRSETKKRPRPTLAVTVRWVNADGSDGKSLATTSIESDNTFSTGRQIRSLGPTRSLPSAVIPTVLRAPAANTCRLTSR
jgi:hypothetical protein